MKLEEFKLHCARAWPTPEDPWRYMEFGRGVWEALGITDVDVMDIDNGGDDEVDCGEGNDTVLAEASDTVINCETVETVS